MKRDSTLFKMLSFIILAGAFGIVQYYIWSNVFITEFQSDCTDTLLWAQATLESGKLFKPTFDYAYRLAFGGQWLFLPFLKLFGLGMTALRSGMCLFTILFTLVQIFFFRSLETTKKTAFLDTAVMLLAVCATKKTREIFYGHVIHYSLAVFYLLLVFIFLRKILKADSFKKGILPAVFFTLFLFMCSGNGTVEMLFVTLPLLAGCLIEYYLSGNKKLPVVLFCIAAAACSGFLFSKTLNTNYSDSYSVIVPPESWSENFRLFPVRWISLFYLLPEKNLDSFSAVWIKTVFKTLIALTMLAGLLLSFSRYKLIKNAADRIFIFSTWAMFGAFLFFFVFGKISDVDWRLLPLVFACEVVVLIVFGQFISGKEERTLSAGLALLCGLLLGVHSISNALSVLRLSYDKKIWFAEDGLYNTLKAHDLDYGFITSYWLSNSITVLSDDTLHPRVVSWDEGHVYLNPFNSDVAWYDDQPGVDRYFLALQEDQYDPNMPEAQAASEIYTCTQEDTRNSRTENYVILVLDHNIMKEAYENLLPRYRQE